MRAGIITEIHRMMRRDKNVYFLTGDLGYSVLEAMRQEFPDRVINMGVAEQNMIGVAAGLALSGKKVYVYSIIPFVTMRCYEQIRNDICYNDCDVTILGVGQGFSYGILSATHFALEDIAILRPLPNISIFAPADETEAVLGLKALYKKKHPCYIRIGKKTEPVIYEKPYKLSIGRGHVIQEGSDIAIFATGPILDEVIRAAGLLKEKKGIQSTIVDIHTIKPFDKDIIAKYLKGKKMIFTVEEHFMIGGLGSAVAEVIASYSKTPPLKMIGAGDVFVKHVGSQDYLRDKVGLSARKIVDSIAQALSKI